MPEVFVDTVAWLALLNTRDSLHHGANAIFADLRSQKCLLVTTEFVLLEVGNALSSPQFRVKTAIFLKGLSEASDVEIIVSSRELFSQGLELYQNRFDKEWSLVDCASFVVMNQNSITEAFTQDHHFEQAGFNILL